MHPSTGKIARLPKSLREELNRRLDDGEPGPLILDWLNHHDAVRAILAAHFGGRPINLVNLTAWRKCSFREWRARRELLGEVQITARHTAKIAQASGRIIDHVATLLAARYAATLAVWDGDPASSAAERLRTLSSLRRDIVALQRSDQLATKSLIEKAHFDEERRKAEQKRRDDEEREAMLQDPEYLRQRQEFVDRMMGRSPPAKPTQLPAHSD